MPAFEYEALDISGRSKRGVISAETQRQARLELRRINLTPVRLSAPVPAPVPAQRPYRGQLQAPARPPLQLSAPLRSPVPQLSFLPAAALMRCNWAQRYPQQ